MDANLKNAIACGIELGSEMFFEADSDSDEEDDTAKLCDFAVPHMKSKQFKIQFRMAPDTFEVLLQMLYTVSNNEIRVGKPQMELDKQAMVLVWCLANIESFRNVANRFRISKSTCWSVLYRNALLLLKINEKYKIISWPTTQKHRMEITQRFETRYRIPDVLGAIAGSHIPIKAPKQNQDSYVNRKNVHSVLLQAVCDSKMLFLDVYAGEAGSIHDWTLYKRSDLYKNIQNDSVQFPHNTHLIGDLSYSLSTNLLVGFKDIGNLTPRQKNFNLIINKARVPIEHAFGLLKGRFRRLKIIETTRMELVPLLIVSACILHNICILQCDSAEDLFDVAAEIEEERKNNPHNSIDTDFEESDNDAAEAKRLNIVNSLPMILTSTK